MINIISDNEFENEVIKSTLPYLVEFWAAWCAPCTMMAATMDVIEEKYTDRIMVGKMNVDEIPDIVERFDVRGVPTLLLFVNGKVVERFVGLVSRDDIERTLKYHI